MTGKLGLRTGMQAALPIAAAYLPVAFALGAASSKIGLSVIDSAIWSALMFSGANQALLLSGLNAGTPIFVLALISIAASARHILYGMAITDRLDASLRSRAVFGYGLTDEVFATTLTTYAAAARKLPGRWLIGMAMSALAVWTFGTALGNAVGDILQTHAPALSAALDFALPALFVGLVWSTASRSLLARMTLSGVLSGAMLAFGRPELAIPVGAIPAVLPDWKAR